jgi:hypothetical protein
LVTNAIVREQVELDGGRTVRGVSMPKIELRRPGLILWWRWLNATVLSTLLATLAGAGVAVLLGLPAVTVGFWIDRSTGSIAEQLLGELHAWILAGVLLVLCLPASGWIAGWLAGALQQVPLRELLPDPRRWVRATRLAWACGTAPAGMLGVAIALQAPAADLAGPFVFGLGVVVALAGSVVLGSILAALMQARLLGVGPGLAKWWVVSNLVGWSTAGLTLVMLLRGQFLSPGNGADLGMLGNPYAQTLNELLLLVIPLADLVAMGTVSGAISGLGLQVISRGRPSPLIRAKPHLFDCFLPAAGGIGLLVVLASLAVTQLTPCAGLDRALGRSGCIREVGLELPYDNVISFTPEGEVFAAGAWDNGVAEVWRLSDASLVLEISSQETGLTTAALSRDGLTVAMVAGDGRVPLYRVSDGMLIRVLELCSTGQREESVNYPDYLEFSPDGRLIAAPDAMDSEHLGMTIWSTDGTHRTCLFPPELGSDAPSALSLAEDGRLAVGTKSGSVLIVQPASGEITHLATTQEYIQAITFSPAGETVAAYLGDGSIRSWSGLDGRALWATPASATPVGGCLVYSPDGEMLATTVPGVRAYVRLISAENGQYLGHFSGACGLAFSSDGQVLVSNGWKTVRYWKIDPDLGSSKP